MKAVNKMLVLCLVVAMIAAMEITDFAKECRSAYLEGKAQSERRAQFKALYANEKIRWLIEF